MTNASSEEAQANGTATALHVLAQHGQLTLVLSVAGALLVLWLRARWCRRRLARSYGRAMRRDGLKRQLRGWSRNHVAAKAGASRRASLAFRKVAGLSILVAAIYVFSTVHGR